MERCKNIRIIFGMICFALFMSIPISAKGEIRTGGVKIGLVCYEEKSGERVVFRRIPELVPNECASYIISVENLGSDAWIRLRVDYTANQSVEESQIDVGDHWLKGISNEWKKAGEYWYYIKPLKQGECVDFCREVQIPDIVSLPDGMKFEIISSAEAIQASNMEPDFSSDQPFAGFYIEDSIGMGNFEKSISGFKVVCEDGADTILNAGQLFADTDELMPGDEKRDIVTIRNTSPYRILLTMREDGEAIEELLLKTINLTIKRQSKEIYNGPLADYTLKNGLTLGEFEKDTEEQLEFILSLSKDAENETAFKTVDLAVIFSVEPVQEDIKVKESERSEETKQDNAQKMYSHPDPTVETGYFGGEWKLIDQENHIWEYHFSDGSKARDGWLYLYNPYSQDINKNGWFCFNKKGTMQFGWIKTENDNWYFCHEISDGNLGRLKKGWHHDLDDKRDYFLDPVTGIMQTGWREIDGKFYYFTPIEETYRQNWFWNTAIGRWIYDFLGYRTYGSMFKDEKTPDGYQVGKIGAWIGE